KEGEFRFELADDSPEGDHLLLLAESSVVRLGLERTLRGAGFRVTLCRTGGEALDRARALALRGESFHVVADRVLPGDAGEGWQGGLELARRVRQISPGARRILLGEARSESAAEAARGAGVSAA